MLPRTFWTAHGDYTKTLQNNSDGHLFNALPVPCSRQVFFFILAGVFPSKLALEASQDGPQHRAKLEAVLGGVLGVQNEAKTAQVGPKMIPRWAEDGSKTRQLSPSR